MQEHIQATKLDDGTCIENIMGHSLVAGKIVPHGSAFKSVVQGIQKQEKADKSKAGETMSTYINVHKTHWVVFNIFWADFWWSFNLSIIPDDTGPCQGWRQKSAEENVVLHWPSSPSIDSEKAEGCWSCFFATGQIHFQTSLSLSLSPSTSQC